jgi:MOSC domain
LSFRATENGTGGRRAVCPRCRERLDGPWYKEFLSVATTRSLAIATCIGQSRSPAKRHVAWQDCPHRHPEEASARPCHRSTAQCRWGRPRRFDWPWRAESSRHGYQVDSYRYWERELGRNDFSYGQFGENFTVDGLPDAEVSIGDRYRIGSALFEISQPRVFSRRSRLCFRYVRIYV